MAEPFDLPPTHFERLEAERLKHEQKKELAQIEADRDIKVAREMRKQERTKVLLYVGIAFVVAVVILGIVTAIYFGTTDGEGKGAVEQKREQTCIENGGGWVPEGLLSDYADAGLCVYPGERVSSE